MKIYHVGMMKSGTTFLQQILSSNQAALKKHGWSYPGNRLNQQHACYALCGEHIPWRFPAVPEALGKDLVQALRSAKTPNSVISAEALSCLSKQGIAHFIDKVGAPDRVVFTIRGLSSAIPSSWQQLIKGGASISYPGYFKQLRTQRGSLSGIWSNYAFGHAIELWSQVAPVDVVIVPTQGQKSDLASLFFDACGMEFSDSFATDIESASSNISLSMELTEILRLINQLLKDDKSQSEAVRKYFLNKMAFPLAGKYRGTKITLPQRYCEQVNNWNNEELELLQRHADRVYGQMDDLSVTGQDMPELDEKMLLQSAATLISQYIAANVS
ncbi:hypothetical protein [Thalassotalea sp. Y01]|uniref:hypothetical protein n=1 Tax=Thalassotalea sp. Y01 TaxID=2729613 RepID=UPI00145C3C45|nr:hypothetical protein [Thalassotalea sp. Y01]NMP14782.1 sulfotransferase [Thalassotalea sp. Y01]